MTSGEGKSLPPENGNPTPDTYLLSLTTDNCSPIINQFSSPLDTRPSPPPYFPKRK